MTAVNYLWNPINDNIVREFDDAGNTIAEYTTEPDLYGNVVSQYRNGQTSYLLSDGQGNTTELTNDAGDVTDVIRYSAFGKVTQRTGSTEIPFQYVGQKGYLSDEVAAHYVVRRRILASRYGRWLSVDPAVGDTVLAYAYARSNPINMFDASGLVPQPVAKSCSIKAESCQLGTLWASSIWLQDQEGKPHWPRETPSVEKVGIGICIGFWDWPPRPQCCELNCVEYKFIQVLWTEPPGFDDLPVVIDNPGDADPWYGGSVGQDGIILQPGTGRRVDPRTGRELKDGQPIGEPIYPPEVTSLFIKATSLMCDRPRIGNGALDAQLGNRPGKFTQRFETCITCVRTGMDVILGCVKWGYGRIIAANLDRTSAFWIGPSCSGTPSPDFRKALNDPDAKHSNLDYDEGEEYRICKS